MLPWFCRPHLIVQYFLYVSFYCMCLHINYKTMGLVVTLQYTEHIDHASLSFCLVLPFLSTFLQVAKDFQYSFLPCPTLALPYVQCLLFYYSHKTDSVLHIWNLSGYVWLISLNAVIVSSNHDAVNNRISFFSWLSNILLYTYTTFSLSTHLLDSWFHFNIGLFGEVL